MSGDLGAREGAVPEPRPVELAAARVTVQEFLAELDGRPRAGCAALSSPASKRAVRGLVVEAR